MKKVLTVTSLIYCSILAFSSLVLAASIGSSIPDSKHDAVSLSIGVEDNFVFERSIKESGSMTGGNAQNTNQAYAIATLQPADFLTLYGKLGVANLEEKFDWDINRSQTIKFDYGLLAGGGVNLLYNLDNGLGIGWDNQMSWWHTEANSVTGSNGPSFISKGSVNNLEAQSTIYTKYDLSLNEDSVFTPYVGASYSLFRSCIDKEIEIKDDLYVYTYGDAENKDNLGVVAGLNYKLGRNLLFGLEGHFLAETALTGRLTYKF